MKDENDVSYIIVCLQVVEMYSLMKEIELYIRSSYIVFLFVKSESNIFIEEIKHNLCAFISL